jgi:hypothetical protein
MQRALAFDDTPALSVPLPFLLAAPWFALAAALLLLWQGEAALATRWSPVTVALTHLLTLGFLGMSMAGALLQLLPVVADFAIPRIRLVAHAAWAGLACGAPLLAAALLAGVPALFGAAALMLGLPLLALLIALGCALARRASPGALPMIAGMRLAVPALGVTAALGLSLAAFFAGGPALPVVMLADLHAAWGLLGWVAVLVAAVAFQVIPMFQATPTYPRALAYVLPPAIALLLAACSAAAALRPAWRRLPGPALALCLAAFACVTLYLLYKRKRPAPDVTTLYWRLSMASLLACVALYLWPGEDSNWRALLLGVLFIAGFAMSAVNGMLYKIVPFLLWYHLAQAGVARGAVPGVNAWIAERGAKWQFRWHAAAVAALAAAVLAPVLARAAAVVFALACAWLALALSQAALRYRRILAKSALERT